MGARNICPLKSDWSFIHSKIWTEKTPKVRPGQHRSCIFEKWFVNSSNIKYCFHQATPQVLDPASPAQSFEGLILTIKWHCISHLMISHSAHPPFLWAGSLRCTAQHTPRGSLSNLGQTTYRKTLLFYHSQSFSILANSLFKLRQNPHTALTLGSRCASCTTADVSTDSHMQDHTGWAVSQETELFRLKYWGLRTSKNFVHKFKYK